MAETRVTLRAVHRSYSTGPPWKRRTRAVLRGVDLQLGDGDSLAVLGENGAGKTTLLRLIAGLVCPDAGTIHVLGRAPHKAAARARVGLSSGDDRSLFQRLTCRHNLEFFGSLYGLSQAEVACRIDELSTQLDLSPFIDQRVDHCSAGMRARVGLARALLSAPHVLLLDEPTKSLDPSHQSRVHEVLRRRVSCGLTLIAVTHSVAEAEALKASTAVLREGKLHL